jgi:O-methyltransferase
MFSAIRSWANKRPILRAAIVRTRPWRARLSWRAWRAQLIAHGVGPWRPLVPEDDLKECIRNALDRLMEGESGFRMGNYLEFGVSRGTSLACVYQVLNEKGLLHNRLFGFDSFKGMPAEAANEGWRAGQYHSTLGATRRYLRKRGVDADRTCLVKGWFADTLKPEKVSEYDIDHASLIMIDCDIYSASKDALDFCAPLIRSAAVIMFDDWGWRSDKNLIGQREAFEEFLANNPDFTADPLPAYHRAARAFMVRRTHVMKSTGNQP